MGCRKGFFFKHFSYIKNDFLIVENKFLRMELNSLERFSLAPLNLKFTAIC